MRYCEYTDFTRRYGDRGYFQLRRLSLLPGFDSNIITSHAMLGDAFFSFRAEELTLHAQKIDSRLLYWLHEVCAWTRHSRFAPVLNERLRSKHGLKKFLDQVSAGCESIDDGSKWAASEQYWSCASNIWIWPGEGLGRIGLFDTGSKDTVERPI